MEDAYVTIQQRGVVTLPADIRRKFGLDAPGAQVRIVARDDGVLELHPMIPIPAGQRWFWTDRWQEMEREAEDDIAAGRVRRYESVDAFLADLDDDR